MCPSTCVATRIPFNAPLYAAVVLLVTAREKELARKAKLEQELAVEEMQHHPSINPHSNEISARLPTTSADRLYKAPFSAEKTGQRPKSAQSPSAQDMTFKVGEEFLSLERLLSFPPPSVSCCLPPCGVPILSQSWVS